MALTPAYFETDNVTGQEQRLTGAGGPLTSNSAWLANHAAEHAAMGVIQPRATGNANIDTATLQACANLGVGVRPIGDFVVNKTILWASNSIVDHTLCKVKLAPQAKCSIYANRHRQNICQSVAGLTITGGIFTVPETGHPWNVGDVVYVEGFLGNSSLNGPKTVLSVVSSGDIPTAWTFAASGANPTNTSLQRIYTSYYNPLSGSAFIRTSNVVTVTEAGHSKKVGDRPYVAGLSGTNSFNGVQTVTAVTDSTWTYSNTGVDETAAGTAQLLLDTNIKLLNCDLDWDKDNQLVSDQTQGYVIWFGNVSRWEVSGIVRNNNGRSFQNYNSNFGYIPNLHTIVGRVGVQFDGFCGFIRFGRITGQGQTDDCLAIGVTGNFGLINSYTAPPNMIAYNPTQVEGGWVVGTGNMGEFSGDYLSSDSITGILKLYGTTSSRIDSVIVNEITGTGKGTIGDTNQNDVGGSGKTGLTVGLLRINALNNRQTAATPKSLSFNAGVKNIEFLEVGGAAVDSSGTNGTAIEIDACPLDIIVLRNVKSKTGQNGAFLAIKNSTTVGVLQISDSWFEGNDGTNYYGVAVLQSGASTITNVQWCNVKAKNLRALHETNGASTATTHTISNLNLEHCSTGWYCNAVHTMTCIVRGLVSSSVSTGVFALSTGAAAVIRVIGSGLVVAVGKLIGNQGSGTGTFSCAVPDGTAQIDGTAATAFAPVAGDQFWNTNAGFGTGIGQYARTNASAWVKLY